MLLSIIIVNYNVKYFLEQCLYSVQKAIDSIKTEVIVIDNNSPDKSVDYLKIKFPDVIFISNKENMGYAKASNLGWQMAKGEYILFLNPDTILSEDCLKKSVAVLQEQPQTGALGIHMIDGSGSFLPESKRGFPTPGASFYKLFGLTKFYPRSKTFAKYYLGHLQEKENNETDVLSGAYMMLKKEILQKTGGFDESFFMYGEDVDLSYRVRELGYSNYYLAECSIIHFKGESTRKDVRYVKLFYKAMSIFVKKHYGKQSWWFGVLLQTAISLRQVLSFAGRFFSPGKQSSKGKKIINTLIIGTKDEIQETEDILTNNKEVKRNIQSVESISGINTAISLYKTDEIIFCAGVISFNKIIFCIQNLPPAISFKFHAAGSGSIVGSGSKNNNGEALTL